MPLFSPLRAACDARPAPCRVRLSEVAPFPWDRVAFVTGDQVDAAALGVDAFEPAWLENSIVFMEGRKVVRRDRMPYHSGWFPSVDPDPIYDGTVFLGDDPEQPLAVFTRDADSFTVTEVDEPSGHTLWLGHVPSQ